METQDVNLPASPANDDFSQEELRQMWPWLIVQERVEGLRTLPRDLAEDLFFALTAREQAEIILAFPAPERRSWMRALAPDDAADLLQELDIETRDALFMLLDEPTKKEVTALMAYAEDAAGGLMSPRFARLRPDMTVDEAISYLRKQAREHLETIYYLFVLDEQQHLLGVLSFRELFTAKANRLVRDVMRMDVVKVDENTDQEALSRLFSEHGLIAVPVIDADNRLKGIVTVDDIVDVVQEEATEDIQKIGGMQALDAPYLDVGLWSMLKKRAPWLIVLLLGEMLTTTAMGHFEEEIKRVVFLASMVPLIISSGGNSGSQATTLVIRAMALNEVRLKDWYRVVQRELRAGVALGLILGVIGFIRIIGWELVFNTYGEHYIRVAFAISLSLVGVVLCGTMAGSTLPFALKRIGLDPASASAPLVATLVDVTGLLIYFSVAIAVLKGTLL